MKPPPSNQDQDYLSKYWDVLAAIAWKEYKAHGRGAVLIQNTDQSDEEAIYITVDKLGSPTTQQYAHIAAGYDAHQEIVVILMRPAMPVMAYKGCLPGRNTSPTAYRQLDALLAGNWAGKYNRHR